MTFSFCSFKGSLIFELARFKNTVVKFEHVDFGNLDISFDQFQARSIFFLDDKLASHIQFGICETESIVFQDCIFEKTINCEYLKFEKISFLNCINLGQITIGWDKHDILHAIKKGINYGRLGNNKPFTVDELASQFRMLKENFHNIGYYDDEDKAYRAYMKYKRKSINGILSIFQSIKCNLRILKKNHWKKTPQLVGLTENKSTFNFFRLIWNSIRKVFFFTFGMIGGYGTKPFSILVTSGVIVACCGIINYFTKESHTIREALYQSALTFLTIGDGSNHFVNVIEGFLGLVLMSYFTVALVRKLLR